MFYLCLYLYLQCIKNKKIQLYFDFYFFGPLFIYILKTFNKLFIFTLSINFYKMNRNDKYCIFI